MLPRATRGRVGVGFALLGLLLAGTATLSEDAGAAGAGGAGGAGGGVNCTQVCTDLFNCGLQGVGGNQLCPPWQPRRSAWPLLHADADLAIAQR